MHAFNPYTREAEAEDWEFQARLGYNGEPLSQKLN
jgi:hypothetical protein